MSTIREVIAVETNRIEVELADLSAKYESEKTRLSDDLANVKAHLSTFGQWVDTEVEIFKAATANFLNRFGL